MPYVDANELNKQWKIVQEMWDRKFLDRLENGSPSEFGEWLDDFKRRQSNPSNT